MKPILHERDLGEVADSLGGCIWFWLALLIGEDNFVGAGLKGKRKIEFQGFVIAQGLDAGEVEVLEISVAVEIFATDVAAGEGV